MFVVQINRTSAKITFCRNKKHSAGWISILKSDIMNHIFMQGLGGARHFSLNVLFQSCFFTSFLTNGGMISWVRAMHYLNVIQSVLLHLLGHFSYYTFFFFISWQTDVGGCLCKLYPKRNFCLKIKYDRWACKIFHVCLNSPRTQLKLTVIEKHKSGKLLSS